MGSCPAHMHKSSPEDMKNGYRDAPAPEHLFKVDSGSDLLDEKRKEGCHQVAAKCLWLSQRSRPDMQLATGFHCTRAKEPAEQGWQKLKHMMSDAFGLAWSWQANA